jgi:hypothetical protein
LGIHRCKWEQWKKDTKKASELQAQVRLLEEEKGKMSSLLGSILTCREPSPVYSVLLNERYFMFQFRVVATCKPYKVTSLETFLQVYYESNKEDKNLLCELYQHNILLDFEPEWNPTPFVGDI